MDTDIDGGGAVCNLSTQVVQAGRSIHIQPCLYHEFEASFGYVRSCLKKEEEKQTLSIDKQATSLSSKTFSDSVVFQGNLDTKIV